MMPKFGTSRYLNPKASIDNPRRIGTYVRTVRRTGRLNPGTYYELTDGKGDFWLHEANQLVAADGSVKNAPPDTLPCGHDPKWLMEDGECLLCDEIGKEREKIAAWFEQRMFARNSNWSVAQMIRRGEYDG